MNNCAISSRTNKKSVSCIEKPILIEIVKKLTNNSINLRIFKKQTLKDVIIKLTGKQEEDWNKIKILSGVIEEKSTFKQKIKNKIDGVWMLDSMQIDTIMNQYVKHIDNDFIYFGSYSSNEFEKYPEKIKQIKKYLLDKNRIGVVINTDIISGRGLHWVSVYITKTRINYFDSNGMLPGNNIKYFLESFKKPITINRYRFQHNKGTCGMWAIKFLMSKAVNKNLKENLTDKSVNDLKNVYFRN